MQFKKSKIPLPNSEIKSYFCAVNLVVAHCTSYNCFHGAEPQSDRLFNHSFFYYYDHQLHQVTRSIITG